MAVDPSTGHEFAELPSTSPDEVAELVEDAHRALIVELDWRVPSVRAAALARLARLVEDEAENLAELETRDTGVPLSRARDDVTATARVLDALRPYEGRTTPLGPQTLEYTFGAPWGVCGVILSWRRPLHAAARLVGPALAAGNAVIVKPSELASISPLRLADLAERAGVPRGLLQVATGDGATGAALAQQADHVTFAGAATTAREVAANCASRLVPLELELTGEPVHVVFADGAPKQLSGRVLIEAPVYHDTVARATEELAKLKLGPGIEDPDVGPLISQRHLDRALTAGAEPAGGLFVRPHLSPQRFTDEREIEVGGDLAVVWTRDLARAHRIARHLPAAHVFVNGPAEPPVKPIEAYTRIKQVRVALDG